MLQTTNTCPNEVADLQGQRNQTVNNHAYTVKSVNMDYCRNLVFIWTLRITVCVCLCMFYEEIWPCSSVKHKVCAGFILKSRPTFKRHAWHFSKHTISLTVYLDFIALTAKKMQKTPFHASR